MSDERGFTLLEVLVAFTIAALALVALFKGAGTGLNSVEAAGRYAEAVSRAKSHLAGIGRDVAATPGELQGDDGNGYHWRIRIQPIGTTKPPEGGNMANPPPVKISLYAVMVGISWTDNGQRREVLLHSERLGRAADATNE
jgi:general secretion pathway protein I